MFFTSIAIFWCGVRLLWAQDALRPLPIDTLLTSSSLSPFLGPSIAPDGTLMAYTVMDRGRATNHMDRVQEFRTAVPWSVSGADIWISDLNGEHKRKLTKGSADNWGGSWSPDSKLLAFFSDRESKATPPEARLWIWDRAKDSFHQVGDFPITRMQREILWALDNHHVIITLLPDDMSRQEYLARALGKTAAYGTANSDGVTAEVFSFDPATKGAPQTDQANPDMNLGDLALVDVASGAIQRISHGQRIQYSAVSPDGKNVGWITLKGSEIAGSQQQFGGLETCDLGSMVSRELVKSYPMDWEARFSWSPESDLVAYQAIGISTQPDDTYVISLRDAKVRDVARGVVKDQSKSRGDAQVLWAGGMLVISREGTLWRVPLDGSGAVRFAELPGRQLKAIEMASGQWWSSDNGSSGLAFTFDPSSKKAGLAKINLRSGEVKSLYEEEKNYGGYDNKTAVTPDRQALIYPAEDASHPADLWRAETNGDHRQQISEVAPELGRFSLGRTGLIEWRAIDGEVLHGAVIYPVGYQPGKRYPLIVKAYGGSEVSRDLYRFGFALAPIDNLQIFASHGYAVLYADSRQHLGTPMTDLMKTIMPGVDKAIEMGLADPNHIGITGHSYGGYTTLSLIVQTTRFKAAVARAGPADLLAAYGALQPDGTNYMMSWAETGQGLMGGSIWQYRDRYIDNSPMFFLDRVTTPLLMIHGGNDTAVAPMLADEAFSDLRRLGKRVESVRYAGEEHWEGNWTLANQKDSLTRTIAWFDHYLKDEAAATVQK